MMMNDVVKSSELSELFCDFNTIIHSDEVNDLCRKKKCDFTRNRNMNFYSIIYYFIFRNYCKFSSFRACGISPNSVPFLQFPSTMPLSSNCSRRLLACLVQSFLFVSLIVSLFISPSQARPQQEVKDIIKNLVEKWVFQLISILHT